MKVNFQPAINFQRKLKLSEEKEYSEVLALAKEKAAHGCGKSILIVPTSSLPQNAANNTGVGNLGDKEAQNFFDFAKKYWGINEIQLLPTGQYHSHNGCYPMYSGTSMNLGNHIINLKDYLSETDFNKIVSANSISDRVNFSNVVLTDSVSERVLKSLFKDMKPDLRSGFENYKKECEQLLERKSLFVALSELYNDSDYRSWQYIDKNLFDENRVDSKMREERIKEIKELKSESIEFYKFKNFLAENSFKKAKKELNQKGIKLNGDLICGFSFDEKWANPKAFIKDLKMAKWNFPVLDVNSPDAENLLREKVRFYAKRFDGIRVDASWTYVSPNVINKKTETNYKLENGTKFLDIIDDEMMKVKGINYRRADIMHEFAANSKTEFNIHDYFGTIKPFVRDRVKIYTSEHMSSDWGTASAYLLRGWSDNDFIIGATNHDSKNMQPSEKQKKILSKILNIPKEKLSDAKEFIKAKFAEPLRAKNNMLFFIPALGLNSKFQHNDDKILNYTSKIPENYEELYFSALQDGRGFNPMDALEKQFRVQGLDKTNPKLFKKIVKYRKILEQKAAPRNKIVLGTALACISIIGLYFILNNKKDYSSSK